MAHCWSTVYPGVEINAMSAEEVQRLIERNTRNDLGAVRQAVWLLHPDHQWIYIIAADEAGNIIEHGKLPLEYLPKVIGPEQMGGFPDISQRICRPLGQFVEFMASRHPNAVNHVMSEAIKARYAARTGLRASTTATVIWFEQPNVATVLVVVVRERCVTSVRELPRALLDSVVIEMSS